MDKCPNCGSLLRIGTSFYTFENDDTPDQPTKCFVNLVMVCVKKECAIYAGPDITNPQMVVDTIRNQVN